MYIVRKLDETGANLRLYDPKAMNNFKLSFPEEVNIKYFKNKYESLKDSDALLIVTD
ncbi:UDP binding domain-containing protein [Methanobacterium aggregans]|uniref:UDP binding domain-containing protein n=1 Tax=Methanobacterium aggregans TaxID=1615586 RepID=UPI00315AA37B